MAAWTEQMIARLRELWAEGHSTAEIGRRMGIGKNSVVGKAHRLGLPARLNPIDRSVSDRQPKPLHRPRHTLPRERTAPVNEVRMPPRMLNPGQLSIPARTANRPALVVEARLPVQVVPPIRRDPAAAPVHRKCQFPLWSGQEKPTHLYCSAPTVPRSDGSRSSWCATHYAVCHTTHAGYGYAAPAAERAA
jgi:hypothetical protein